MLYCEKCQLVINEDKCPKCKSRNLREPLPNDFCLLTKLIPMNAGMLKDVLDQNGIPAVTSSTIGAGIAAYTASYFERIKFLVRYEDLPKATDLVNELFGASDDPESSDFPIEE